MYGNYNNPAMSQIPQMAQYNPYSVNSNNRFNFLQSQATQFTTPTNGIIWVQGIEGAKAYQLVPNSNVMLLDSENEGIFYIKTSDSVGMCTLRVFKYTEITQNNTQNQADMSLYVKRDEIETIIKNYINGGADNGEQSISTADRAESNK